MKKVFIAAAFMAALTAWSCDDDDDKVRGFSIDTKNAELLVGYSNTYPIREGNGDYALTEKGDKCISAEIVTENYAYGAIRITGTAAGETVLTVTDKATGESADIEVKVEESGLFMNARDNVAVNVVGSDPAMVDQIRVDVNDNLVFKKSTEYVAYKDGPAIAEKREDLYVFRSSISHDMQDEDNLYIIVNPASEDNQRTLRMIVKIEDFNYSSGISVYFNFFGLNLTGTETRMNFGGGTSIGGGSGMTAKLLLEEDLTGEFSGYEGVEKVTVLYEMELSIKALPAISLNLTIEPGES